MKGLSARKDVWRTKPMQLKTVTVWFCSDFWCLCCDVSSPRLLWFVNSRGGTSGIYLLAITLLFRSDMFHFSRLWPHLIYCRFCDRAKSEIEFAINCASGNGLRPQFVIRTTTLLGTLFRMWCHPMENSLRIWRFISFLTLESLPRLPLFTHRLETFFRFSEHFFK